MCDCRDREMAAEPDPRATIAGGLRGSGMAVSATEENLRRQQDPNRRLITNLMQQRSDLERRIGMINRALVLTERNPDAVELAVLTAEVGGLY